MQQITIMIIFKLQAILCLVNIYNIGINAAYD